MLLALRRFARWLFDDTTFFRVCMFLAGACILAGIAWALWTSWPIEWWIWLLILPMTGFGALLVAMAIFASDRRFERSLGLLSDGGDIPVVLFFLVVMFVALPLTIVLRLLRQSLR